MNNDIHSMIDSLLSPDSIQPKVDILESNISSALKVSDDELTASVVISREGTGAVAEIMDLAVKQFLTRLSIPATIIGKNLISLLQPNAVIPDEKGRNIRFAVTDHPGSPKVRTVSVKVFSSEIKMEILGYDKTDPENEKIVKYYFEHNQYPGKLLPGGKIDYRELHRFPSVKQGDKILFVRYQLAGTPGVTYSGRLIPVKKPDSLKMRLNNGIAREEVYSENGTPAGYFLVADKDGVIIIKKTENGAVSEIGVSNEIKLDKIDFSTGNIEAEFTSPLDIEAEEVGNEFKVNVNGKIKITHLNGGIVSTTQSAFIDNIRSDSSVKAFKNIQTKNVADSSLESETGTILIEGEIRDSKLNAPEILFKCRKGLMLNNTIHTEVCDLSGGYYCGTNTFIFGLPLFERIDDLKGQLEALKTTFEHSRKIFEEEKKHLLPLLKKLSAEIKDPEMINLFKLLLRCFQSLEFNFAYDALEKLRRVVNVMMIDKIKKSFEALQKLSSQQFEIEEEINRTKTSLNEAETRLNNIRFKISGELHPIATIKIFCERAINIEEPTQIIKAGNKDANEKIAIQGYYNTREGFVSKYVC